MKTPSRASATLELADGTVRVSGTLGFDTVSALLASGSDVIRNGRAAVVDLAGVTGGDSAGLALLIEWLSVARAAARPLRYEHLPTPLLHLARLGEIEDLLARGV